MAAAAAVSTGARPPRRKSLKRLRGDDEDDDISVAPALPPPTRRPRLLRRSSDDEESVAAEEKKPQLILPATRPTAPTPIITRETSIIQEMNDVRKTLSQTARNYLEMMERFNPHVMPRNPRSLKPATLRKKPTQFKGPEQPIVRIHTFQHDQQVLFYPVERFSPLKPDLKIKARPCRNEQNCIGVATPRLECRTFPGNAPAFVHGPYMEFYTPDELRAWYLTGAHPRVHKECLECLRYTWADLALYTQGTGQAWGPTSILQSFGNTVGGPTGYAADCCTMPATHGPFNGLMQPVARRRDDRVFINWDPVTRAPFVDQRGLASAEIQFADNYPRDLWRKVRADYLQEKDQAAANTTTTATQDFPPGATATTTTPPSTSGP